MATIEDLRTTASRLEDEFLNVLCHFPFDEELASAKAKAVKAADEAVRRAELDARFTALRSGKRR